MQAEIYYFSGTGNSLFIAKELAHSLEARLTPVALVMHNQEIRSQADVIGIVFPVYYGGIPGIIKEFAGRLRDLDGKFVFAVCNYGGAAGSTLRVLKRILDTSGGTLSAGFGVQMPQNGFRKAYENREQVLARGKERLASITEAVRTRKSGISMTNQMVELIGTPLYALLKPLYTKTFRKMTDSPPGTRVEQMTILLDRSFVANANCKGCGICAQVCPVKNIVIVEAKPSWQNRCENCLACYNWCPNRAIEGGPAQQGHFYHHPEIKLKDMLDNAPRKEE